MAEVLTGLQIALARHRETVGRGDRLDDEGGDVALAQHLFQRALVVEGDLDEFVGPVGEEDLGKPFIPGGDRQAGMAVIALDDRHDLAPLGGVTRRLQGDFHRFGPARSEDRVFHVRSGLDQLFGEGRPRDGGEPVVAHVEIVEPGFQYLDQFGMAVAEIVGPAIQVQVDQPLARHVVEEVPLATVDHHRRAGILPEADLSGIPVLRRLREEVLLRVKSEVSVVEHLILPSCHTKPSIILLSCNIFCPTSVIL